jgi:hypothetical protein
VRHACYRLGRIKPAIVLEPISLRLGKTVLGEKDRSGQPIIFRDGLDDGFPRKIPKCHEAHPLKGSVCIFSISAKVTWKGGEGTHVREKGAILREG